MHRIKITTLLQLAKVAFEQKKMEMEMEMEMEIINSGLLPAEITINILSRLPVDSVIQCKRVCKPWRSFIDHNPTFLELHTHRFIVSLSSSSSSGQLIKSAAFGFFILVTKCLSRTNYRLHFGQEYHNNNYDHANNENKHITSTSVNYCVKLSSESIPNYPFHPFSDCFKCISSCNGLILIASMLREDGFMYVFNPVTREYVHLPLEEEQEEVYDSRVRMLGSITSTGFGYHPLINEYKVVRITYLRNGSYRSENDRGYYISVYTLGSGRWRRRRESKYPVDELVDESVCVFDHPGVLLNGVLHWIGISVGVIVTFDLANEELDILPLPQYYDDPMLWDDGVELDILLPLPQDYENPVLWDDDMNLHLGVLGGCLCLSITSFLHSDVFKSTVGVWVLMNKKEEEEYSDSSWTKKFSILAEGDSGLHGKYELIATLESGKILFTRYHGRRHHLVSYDPETGNVDDEDESFHGHLNGWSDIIPYVKSFVSLKALGEEDAKYISI